MKSSNYTKRSYKSYSAIYDILEEQARMWNQRESEGVVKLLLLITRWR